VRTFFGLVGLGMFLGFGALFVTNVQDLRAYPEVPTRTTVHDAVLRETPGPGAWIELTDVRFPCDQPEQSPTGTRYRLGFGATEEDRIIVSGARPCSDTPVSVIGELATATPGRIVDLAFPAYPFESWPRPWQSTLWTANGPEDARIGIILLPPFALFGLIILAFYWKPEPTRAAKRELLEPEPNAAPWSDDERVLPARPLALATTSLFDRLLSFSALIIMGWMMLALAWFSYSSSASWFGAILLLFFGAIGGFLVFAAFKAAWSWRKNANPEGPRVEALAQLDFERPLLANGVDVGNLQLGFKHPLTGVAVERTIALNESRPLLIDGYLFLVWSSDPNAVMLIAEDFSPYDLTPAEQRESLRRLTRWVASKPKT
jgi:hypothetical protein